MRDDYVNIGAMRVEFPLAERPAGFQLPTSILGARPGYTPTADEATAGREPLSDLLNELHSLARRTGLVRVRSVDYADHQAIYRSLMRHAGNATPDAPVIGRPGIGRSRISLPRNRPSTCCRTCACRMEACSAWSFTATCWRVRPMCGSNRPSGMRRCTGSWPMRPRAGVSREGGQATAGRAGGVRSHRSR